MADGDHVAWTAITGWQFLQVAVLNDDAMRRVVRLLPFQSREP